MRLLSKIIVMAILVFNAAARSEENQKIPIPTIAEQKEAEKTIRGIFKDEFSKNDARDKRSLAQLLSAQANDTKDDNVSRFELRALSATLAAQSGDLDLSLSIMDKLADEFSGDLRALKKSVIAALPTGGKDSALAKVVVAYSTLIDKPDDPAASQALGYYECFVKGNWVKGLSMLANSPNAALHAAVEKDMAGSDDGATQVALGDTWWELGDKETTKDFKTLFQERASFWYRKASTAVTGLQKVKNEKRILAAEVASATLLTSYGTPQPPLLAPVQKKPMDSVTAAEDDWSDGKTWAGHIYKISRSVKKRTAIVKTIEAGTEILGPGPLDLASVYLEAGSKLFLNGRPEEPVIMRNAHIVISDKGCLIAHYTVFEDCQLNPVKFANEPYLTKFRNCIFLKCRLGVMEDSGINVQFCDCLFINTSCTLHSGVSKTVFTPPAIPTWNAFAGDIFMNCDIIPNEFLCSAECSFVGCKFLGDLEFANPTDIEIGAYVAGCTGSPPAGTKERKARWVKPAEPYPAPLLPMPAIQALFPKVKQALELGKAYRWISKFAAYRVSSVYNQEVPTPNLLNGEGDAYNHTHSFQTNSETAPWIVIDLGRRHAVAALEIENRSDIPERADTLTASVSDSPDGPWEEVWQAGRVQAQWNVELGHAYPCRFVKLSLRKKEFLNLNQVRIFEK